METEQDPRYAGYVQRKESEGKTPKPYAAWFKQIERLDAAAAERRTVEGAADPRNPDDLADDPALDNQATAAQEMAAIAEQQMKLVEAKMAELDARMAELDAREAAIGQAEMDGGELPLLPEVGADHVNASSLGDLTHVQASAPARVKPQTLDDFPGAEQLHFSCPANRNRVEIMQAGRKVLINNQVVVLEHRAIEFTEHHYTADLLSQEGAERAAWLLQCDSFRRGEIVLVPTVVVAPKGVRTGPRTSGIEPARIERPAGPLSAAVR